MRTPCRCAPGMSPFRRCVRGISSVVCATGYAPEHRPKARRSPPPPHAMTVSDHPTTRAVNQLVTRLNIEHQSLWGASHAHQMEALQTDEQITPITTIKRHTAAAGKARHHPRSLKTAGVEVRSSPGTSTSTRNPRPRPGHPHSTRKSRK